VTCTHACRVCRWVKTLTKAGKDLKLKRAARAIVRGRVVATVGIVVMNHQVGKVIQLAVQMERMWSNARQTAPGFLCVAVVLMSLCALVPLMFCFLCVLHVFGFRASTVSKCRLSATSTCRGPQSV